MAINQLIFKKGEGDTCFQSFHSENKKWQPFLCGNGCTGDLKNRGPSLALEFHFLVTSNQI
ncbi:hypothetical protein BT93_C1940 [Corymbia citriodora subsp. variegata]|nr:hypothetical protein BT93_C1940 [Corymbia citriodora subsp. variegata]